MADYYLLNPYKEIYKKTDGLFLLLALLFFCSFFLETAAHRIVLYVMTPAFLWYFKNNKTLLLSMAKTRSFVVMAAYLIYFTISATWSQGVAELTVLNGVKEGLCIAIFSAALALCVLRNRGKLSREELFMASLPVIGLMGLAILLFMLNNSSLAGGRLIAPGRYENPIHYGIFGGVFTLFLVSLGKLKTLKLELGRQAAIAFTLIVIGLTKSRTAFVAFAANILGLGMLGRARSALILLSFAITAALTCFLIWDLSLTRIVAKADNNRFAIWTLAVEEIRARPLAGYGIADESKFTLPGMSKNHAWKSTHNIILGHLHTGGIIGFFFFVLLFSQIAYSNLKAYLQSRACDSKCFLPFFALMLTIFGLVSSQFVFSHFAVNMNIQWLIFWVPFALAWAFEVERKLQGSPD